MYVLAILLVHNDLFHTNEDVVGLPRLKQSANVIIWNNLMIISRVSGGSNVWKQQIWCKLFVWHENKWNENKIYTLQRLVLDKVDKRFVQFKNPCNYWLLFPSVVKCILVSVTGLKKLQTYNFWENASACNGSLAFKPSLLSLLALLISEYISKNFVHGRLVAKNTNKTPASTSKLLWYAHCGLQKNWNRKLRKCNNPHT